MESPAAVWRRVTAVAFDVDSTVCTDEGIDKLAAHCGVGAEVAAWTARAMGGGVTYQESLKARLDIIRPTLAQVQALHDEGPQLTPGVAELVRTLRARGVHVCVTTVH